MRANFFVMFPVSTLQGRARAPTWAPSRRPERKGFDNALVREFSQHHQCGHDQHHQPGAARAGPGDPCGGVLVRPSRWRQAWWCCSPQRPPPARTGAREFAIMRAVGTAAACCARYSAPSLQASGLLAGFCGLPSWQRPWVGPWRTTCSNLTGPCSSGCRVAGASAGAAPGAGCRLVGSARGARSPGGGNPAPRRELIALILSCSRTFHGRWQHFLLIEHRIQEPTCKTPFDTAGRTRDRQHGGPLLRPDGPGARLRGVARGARQLAGQGAGPPVLVSVRLDGRARSTSWSASATRACAHGTCRSRSAFWSAISGWPAWISPWGTRA